MSGLHMGEMAEFCV